MPDRSSVQMGKLIKNWHLNRFLVDAFGLKLDRLLKMGLEGL